MTVYVNDERLEVTGPATIESLLEVRNLNGAGGIAVAVDNQVVPRGRWSRFELEEGARVVIITATQGG